MIKRIMLIAVVLLLGLGLNWDAMAQEGQPAGMSTQASPEAIRSITVLTAHGKIVEVNKSKKLVTLEVPEGRRLSVMVENPYNLESAKVGDPVVLRFYEVVTIRKKKPGEVVPSASLKEGIATAKPGAVPGAIAEQKVSLLVSVTAIDEAHGAVTVKAPDGTVEQVKAKNPKNLKLVKVGDELVVTLARAIAISVEKESAS